MPPSKPKVAPDDSRSEASSTREKFGSLLASSAQGKGRRITSGLGTTNSTRETVNTVGGLGSVNSSSAIAIIGQDTNLGMQWSTVDPPILHAYRHAYHLDTPSAFKTGFNQAVLSRSTIGKLSPTLARTKDHRRQSKEQLANTVRKHFNGLGIQENEVVVDFLYKVRNQDKSFRMRFSPQRLR